MSHSNVNSNNIAWSLFSHTNVALDELYSPFTIIGASSDQVFIII